MGIRIVVTKSPEPLHRDITISGNSISNFGGAGIDLNRGSTADTIEGLEISGNHILVDAAPSPNDLVGIRFRSDNKSPWVEHALVSGNQIGAQVGTPIVRGKGVPYIITSGNPTGPAFFQGDGIPTSILGPVGSRFLRLDTDPAEVCAFAPGAADDDPRLLLTLESDSGDLIWLAAHERACGVPEKGVGL